MASSPPGSPALGPQRPSIDLCLAILPDKLKLAKLPLSEASVHSAALIRLLLLDGPRHDRFFSFVESPHEITLVIEERDLAASFEGGINLETTPGRWRALRISDGSLGFQNVGMCQRLSGPLAAASISVLYISTYETDYVLVEESKLSLTVAVLRATYGEIEIEGDSELERVEIIDSVGMGGGTVSSTKGGESDAAVLRESCGGETGTHAHPLFLLPLQLMLSNLRKEAVPSHTHAVLELFLHRGDTPRFLNFTITEEEISIVHPWGTLSLGESGSSGGQAGLGGGLLGGLHLGHEPWACVQVGEHPLGFEECGIVSSQSKALSDAQISCFYMCTFSFDFVLVATSDLTTAVEALSKRFQVIPSNQVRMGSLTLPPVLSPDAAAAAAVIEGADKRAVAEEARDGLLSLPQPEEPEIPFKGVPMEEDSYEGAVVKIGGDAATDAAFELDYA